MKVLLLFVSLYFNCIGYAQSNAITGVIADADNNQPISACNVFISNTAIGVVTNDTGKFTLYNIPWYNSLRLVVSSVGYETFTYDFSAKQLPLNLKISLNKKIVEMENIQIIPYEKDGWQKYGYIFLRYFLGDSENAYDCQIDNTSIIKFRNNKKDGILEAEADGMLIIRNYHFNYLLRYQLDKFVYNFKTQRVSYSGYTFFQEMEPNQPLSPQFRLRRSQAYNGSITHFIRSLYENKLMQDGFEVRKMNRYLANDTIRNDKKTGHRIYVYDSLGRKKSPPYIVAKVWKDSVDADVLPRDSFLIAGPDNIKNMLSFNNYVALFYLRENEPSRYRVSMRSIETDNFQFSRMKILNNEKKIFIEADGTYNPGFDLLFEGYLGWEKVGDSLPLDYVPEKDKK